MTTEDEPRPMVGIYRARQFITTYLQGDLPNRLVHARNAWQMDDETLPLPAVLEDAPPAFSGVATVYPFGVSTVKMVREDYDGGYNPVYRVTYAIRLFVWVNQRGSESVTRTRDSLVAVVRSALLDHPCLIQADTDGTLDIGVDEATLREDYSDVTAVKGDRYVAGCYISIQITVNEVVDRMPIADTTSFGVTIDKL